MSKQRFILPAIAVAALAIAAFVGVLIPRAKQRAESLNCASAVCSICLAARLWAMDNDGRLPSSFVCMSNEISTTKILMCAADQERKPATSWASLNSENCSYELLSPGLPAIDTNTAILRCRIHGHLGYVDGTVFDGVKRRGKFN